jgi:hypothetical protein
MIDTPRQLSLFDASVPPPPACARSTASYRAKMAIAQQAFELGKRRKLAMPPPPDLRRSIAIRRSFIWRKTQSAASSWR